MHTQGETAVLDGADGPHAIAEPKRSRGLIRLLRAVGRRVASMIDWLFGLASLIVGLATLAALPVLQLFSLGYMLESSGRVARSGRLRDGLIGVREASRIGGAALGAWIALLPVLLVRSFAESAAIISPASRVANAWRIGFHIAAVLAIIHIVLAFARGARIRHFLWPIGHAGWLRRQLHSGGFYIRARDDLWKFAAGLRPWHYFRLGLIGFVGTLVWLLPPGVLISGMQKVPILGFVGVLWLAVVVPWLPILQTRFAVEGRVSALFSLRFIRDRFKRAPWAFAFALLSLLVAAIPLYLLKIEMIPREAAWLPSLVFVVFLMPARLLTGWAYARSLRREKPRHWLLRWIGRLAIIPVTLLYVLVVFLAQYTSWGGLASLYDQHAFLLPVPFLNM